MASWQHAIVALWHCGIVASRHCGILALWHCVLVTLWHCGIAASWHCGTVALWHCGVVALQHCGILALWRRGIVVLWHCGMVAFWHFGIVALWHCGIVALWHSRIVALWHCGSVVGSSDLNHHAVDVCTRNLNKIGKSQYPAGVLTFTRCPVWERMNAGGNDQLQRQCRYSGAARGKEGYAAMHSAFASLQYVTVTFNLNPSDLSWISVNELDNDLAHGPKSAPAT